VISRIEVLNYRCLRFIQRPLDAMHILVGPNASGKTTFLDVISFLGTLVSDGLETAFSERTRNPLDLVWGRGPGVIELALEARIPERLLPLLGEKGFETVRYEVQIAVDPDSYEPEIRAEKALFKRAAPENLARQLAFPQMRPLPASILSARGKGQRLILNKVSGGNDNFYSEVHEESGKGWAPSYRLGPRRSTLENLVGDESKFPVTTWLQSLLKEGVQKIALNSLLIRQASPPGQGRGFRPDGSNLPWVVEDLKRKAPDSFRQWIDHLSTALPDLESVRVVEREDDRHAYLIVGYRGGLEVPSWMVSDGTLRLLALTILAYLPDATGIYLVEEPENGIHPTAVEAVYQSLSSVYDGQVLVATHSPVLLAIAKPQQLLCFAKTPEGATDIVTGDEHPALRDWRGEVNLGDLFAAGVLG
jgi:predicted ATPase